MVNQYSYTTIRDSTGQIVGYQQVTQANPYVPGGIQGQGSPQYQAILNQQAQIQQTPESHAAFVQQPGYVQTGGAATGRAALYQQQFQPLQQSRLSKSMENQPARSTEPIRDLSSQTPTRAQVLFQNTQTDTFNVPAGDVAKIELKEAKAIYDPVGGRVGFYQKPASIYESEGGFKRLYGIEVSSGGTGALQSGKFTIGKGKAGTDVVYTQESAGTKLAEGYNKERAAAILKNPEMYSRTGAEAYGGDVVRLDGRTLAPGQQMGRYPAEKGNLANLVDPYGVNRPKTDFATEPWQIADFGSAPVLQTVDVKGNLAPTSREGLARVGIAMQQNSNGIAANPSYNGLRFTSISKMDNTPLPVETRNNFNIPDVGFDTTLGFGATAANEGTLINPDYSTPMSVEQGVNYGAIPKPVTNLAQPQTREQQVIDLLKQPYSGGILGNLAFGEKAPEVIKGYVGSVSDFGTSLVGWTPFKNKMQTTDPSLEQFRTDKLGMATAPPEEYNAFLQENVQKGNLVVQPGTGQIIENPRLTYDYGEYSKWSVGAGDVVKGKLGFSQAQLDQYGYQIEQKKGIQFIPEKLVFGAGYTLSTDPGKIATAYGAGAVMVVGGEIVGGAYAATTLPARAAAFAVSHPIAATVISGAVKYGIPTALLGATYYGASEGLTATPERTTVNFGKMIPEAGGLVYGAASAKLGIRAIDAGFIGYGSKERKAVYFLEDIVPPVRESINIENIAFTKGGALSTPKPTEFMDLGQLFGGRKAGAFPEGVVEGLKRPELLRQPLTTEVGGIPMRRVDNPITGMSKYEIDVPPVPMDMMPGVGKIGNLIRMETPRSTLLPGSDRPSTFGLPKVEIIQPKGLETSFGGAPMSERMQMSMINPTIQAGTRSGGVASMDTLIQKAATQTRVAPAVSAAKQLNILPSKTSFAEPVSISKTQFEDALFGITESKVASTGKRLPTGMQMDYLREALQQRPNPVFPKATLQTPKTNQGAPQIVIPSTKSLERQMSGPVSVTTPISTKTPIQNPAQPTKQKPMQTYVPVQANPPSQVKQPAKTYVPTSVQIQDPISTKTPTPITPYIPSFTPLLTTVPEKTKTPDTPFIPTVTPTVTPVPPWNEPPRRPITEEPPIPAIFTIWTPPFGGNRSSPRYGARLRTSTATHSVGADLLGASKGAFKPMKMPKRKPFKMMKF